MSVGAIWLLAVALSMDCFAISMASGLSLKRFLWKPVFTIALAFGLFQGIMPVIGWIGAGTFSRLIEKIDHWVAFLILFFLGGRMMWESFKKEDEPKSFNPTSLKVVMTMAVATSIDALAIGISFAFLEMHQFSDILYPVCVIGFVSFVMSLFGIFFGILCEHGGHKMRIELWGGLILIAIGTKILIEHLFFKS